MHLNKKKKNTMYHKPHLLSRLCLYCIAQCTYIASLNGEPEKEIVFCQIIVIFSSLGQSPGRAIILPPASALVAASAIAKC